MTEPNSLDEIPKVTFSEKMIPYVELKEVKRLVCRRIIDEMKELDMARRLDIRATITMLERSILRDMFSFNITDAMIEEERKRLKQ